MIIFLIVYLISTKKTNFTCYVVEDLLQIEKLYKNH